MGEAKRRGTLEKRTRQALKRFKTLPREKGLAEKALETVAPVVLAAFLTAYSARLPYGKELPHMPETASQAAPLILQVAYQPGSSTFANLTIPEDVKKTFAFYGPA